jgi:hypothetical protein
MFQVLLLIFLLDIFSSLGGVKLSGSSAESMNRSTRKGLDNFLEAVLSVINFLLYGLHICKAYYNIY